MSNFLKYTGSTNFCCMCSDGISGLFSTAEAYPKATKTELLYFGLTDGTNFKNNLKGINDTPILLTCNLSDCDASVYHYWNQPDNDTGMNIKMNIPANSNTRYITFSYNNNLVFSIRQIQKIMYVYTYKFNKITGLGSSQGNFDDYAYKYDLFLSNYLAFTDARSDYIKISNKSPKITDLLFYYTSNNINSDNDSLAKTNGGITLSSIGSSIGSNGWFLPTPVTNDGYICHMQSYSTTSDKKYFYKDKMPDVLYVLAVKDDSYNYIMGTLQKTLEIIYSYVS